MKIPEEFKILSKRDFVRLIFKEREEFDRRIEQLEQRLLAYENAHTPPSQQRRYPKREKKEGAKVGAPKGHKGTTRKQPEPTETKTLSLNFCPDCQHTLGKHKRVERRVIEEIPDPQPIRVIEFLQYYYDCNHCGKEVAGNDRELPIEGNIGINLQAQISLRKYEDRLPIRKVAKSIKRDFNIEVTSGTVQDVTRRVADKLSVKYEQMKKEIINSPSINADETGAKLNGKKHWFWVFMNQLVVIFLLRPRRERKVIEEILGKKYKGIATVDGYKAYANIIKNIQRCWAHLLREAKFLAQKYEGQSRVLYNSLCELFKKIKDVSLEMAINERKKIFEDCVNSMKSFMGIAKSYKELKKFAITLENGLKQWFTCVLHPEIEPTNNVAERELREFVVQRKIFGSFRSEKGMEIAEIILSMFATWRRQSLNTYQQLRIALSC